MKFFFMFFLSCLSGYGATVTLRNASASVVVVDSHSVSPFTDAVLTVADLSFVSWPSHASTVQLRDGDVLTVDDTACGVVTPFSSDLEVFMNGFYFMSAVEIFAMILSVFRSARNGTGMEV